MIVIMIQISKHRPLQHNHQARHFPKCVKRQLMAKDGNHSDPVQIDFVVVIRATAVITPKPLTRQPRDSITLKLTTKARTQITQ